MRSARGNREFFVPTLVAKSAARMGHPISVIHEAAGVAGDLGFLVAGEGEDFCAGAFFAGADAEEFESLADEVADELAVLADASGEDEEIESAKLGGIGPDKFADGGGEDVDSERGVLVAGFHGGLETAHVGFSSGERGEA